LVPAPSLDQDTQCKLFPDYVAFQEFTDDPQDLMVRNIHKLDRVLYRSLPAPSNSAKCTWRERGYKAAGSTVTSPGHIPFSPCWFNVGHQLSVSTSLRGGPTAQYLRDDYESLSLLGAALALIHPSLAVRALSILRGIRSKAISNAATDTLAEDTAELWPCPFTAFSIISNRETKLHRDGKGFAPYYDITTTLGHYTDGTFEVPAIGLKFKYDPGTMIGICGKALAHRVEEVEGDRFCHVQYFHRKVLDLISGYLVNERSDHWMRQQDMEQV
jgi:hypothetical protein